MHKIRVTGGVMRIGSGTLLDLSADQALARAQALEKTADGKFKAMRPLEFKAGEVIGVAINDIGKNFRHMAVDAELRPVEAESVKAVKAVAPRRGR